MLSIYKMTGRQLPDPTTLVYKFVGLCSKITPEYREGTEEEWFRLLFKNLDAIRPEARFLEHWITFRVNPARGISEHTKFSSYAKDTIGLHFMYICARGERYGEIVDIVDQLEHLLR
jgi:hypothetical protein